MKIECHKCGHQWNYNGKSKLSACCSRCHSRVNLPVNNSYSEERILDSSRRPIIKPTCLLCNENPSDKTYFCKDCIKKKETTSGDLSFQDRLRVVIKMSKHMDGTKK